MDSVQSKLICNVLVIYQGWYQVDCMHSILEVIFLAQDLVKSDRLGEICNVSAACLVPLLKIRTIVLVTCLPSVLVSSLLYQIVAQHMATG